LTRLPKRRSDDTAEAAAPTRISETDGVGRDPTLEVRREPTNKCAPAARNIVVEWKNRGSKTKIGVRALKPRDAFGYVKSGL
jgi:hypothetical protein